MAEVKLTPAKLAELKKKAEGCDLKHWVVDQHGNVKPVDFDSKVPYLPLAYVEFLKDAEFIAHADPATVLAMVEEISILRRALRELAWDYYTTDLDQNEIEEICNKLIDVAKMQIESEAGQ